MIIRVALAEDQRMVREALAALLSAEPDITIVGEATTGPQALQVALEQQPDVLVLDIGLPGMDGFEVARAVRQRLPGVRVLALSGHADGPSVREMLKAGAGGYVDKSAALNELVQAIRVLMQGRPYVSPELAGDVLGDALGAGRGAPPSTLLSRRERQVLALIAEGKRSLQIGQALKISSATVEAHRRNIMRKLGLHTVAELTRYAVREGIARL